VGALPTTRLCFFSVTVLGRSPNCESRLQVLNDSSHHVLCTEVMSPCLKWVCYVFGFCLSCADGE